jgi:hypothetical protein
MEEEETKKMEEDSSQRLESESSEDIDLVNLSILPEEMLSFSQRLFGYCTLHTNVEQRAFYCFGDIKGRMGIFLRMLQRVMGNDYQEIDKRLILVPPSPIITEPDDGPTESHEDYVIRTLRQIANKQLVVCTNLEPDDVISRLQIKCLTSGGPIMYYHNKRYHFFNPHFKLLIIADHLPKIRNDSINTNLTLIPFANDPVEYGEENLAEGDLVEILQWLRKGAQDWSEEGLQIPLVIQHFNELFYTISQSPQA